MHRVLSVHESGVALEAAPSLLFEYMAATGLETGNVWPNLEELPAPLAKECQNFRSVYANPGDLLVAFDRSEPVGCVGLHAMNVRTADIRRLYVKANRRGSGLGKLLMQQCLIVARSNGFDKVVLDVMPTRTSVVDWYTSLGFKEIDPFEDVPFPMVFLGLDLADD